MTKTDKIVILITASNRDEANNIASLLLDKRKVACVNIVPGIESVFWWQSKINSEQECLLIAKTRSSMLTEIIALVKSIHSYQVPEIIALPIIGGSEEYLNWIDKETGL